MVAHLVTNVSRSDLLQFCSAPPARALGSVKQLPTARLDIRAIALALAVINCTSWSAVPEVAARLQRSTVYTWHCPSLGDQATDLV